MYLEIIRFVKIFVETLAELLEITIIIRVVLSWFPQARINFITKFIRDITSPILRFCYQHTPKFGMLDLSPVVAIVLVELIRYILLLGLQTLATI